MAKNRRTISDIQKALLTNTQYCLLYTSDAADDLLCVDLGGRRIIKKKIINKDSLHQLQYPTCINHPNV